MQGFPKVYGCGTVEGGPAVLMEWICGITLERALPQLPAAIRADGPNGATPTEEGCPFGTDREQCGPTSDADEDAPYPAIASATVAQIGLAVARILLRTHSLDDPFAHRDISLRNIMVSTRQRPLEQQIAAGDFDLYLVDLGSSNIAQGYPSLTMRTGVWRNGTPEFAPPEMLTCDIPELVLLRSSPSIDVYETCSVLYTLYAGRTPYRLRERITASPYLFKVEHDPALLIPRTAADAPLVRAINNGIRTEQSERVSLQELYDELRSWLDAQDGAADGIKGAGEI